MIVCNRQDGLYTPRNVKLFEGAWGKEYSYQSRVFSTGVKKDIPQRACYSKRNICNKNKTSTMRWNVRSLTRHLVYQVPCLHNITKPWCKYFCLIFYIVCYWWRHVVISSIIACHHFLSVKSVSYCALIQISGKCVHMILFSPRVQVPWSNAHARDLCPVPAVLPDQANVRLCQHESGSLQSPRLCTGKVNTCHKYLLS